MVPEWSILRTAAYAVIGIIDIWLFLGNLKALGKLIGLIEMEDPEVDDWLIIRLFAFLVAIAATFVLHHFLH